ncbi:hypothetical protein [Bifidobacterium panos]|uniref:Transcriptional regulator n=1 Tax=Bifidobacterium panos TaxID=2675321 RepID=A0ABX1SY31_9BIFI|nr:hypothetical protein [Bifidobacterium sp. DSM 109963]NMN02749.1 hypothetical protein [Bifidobacterium sp. DSM 109963]
MSIATDEAERYAGPLERAGVKPNAMAIREAYCAGRTAKPTSMEVRTLAIMLAGGELWWMESEDGRRAWDRKARCMLETVRKAVER